MGARLAADRPQVLGSSGLRPQILRSSGVVSKCRGSNATKQTMGLNRAHLQNCRHAAGLCPFASQGLKGSWTAWTVSKWHLVSQQHSRHTRHTRHFNFTSAHTRTTRTTTYHTYHYVLGTTTYYALRTTTYYVLRTTTYYVLLRTTYYVLLRNTN